MAGYGRPVNVRFAASFVTSPIRLVEWNCAGMIWRLKPVKLYINRFSSSACITITPACTCFHKTAPAAKITPKPCYKKDARTGVAVDCVALMPRIDDGGDIKSSVGLAHD
jgi:hypothetical protein